MRTNAVRLTLLLALALGVSGLARAGDGDALENLAAELVAKRSQVEQLSSELELQKASLRDELRALAQQKADLARQVKALEVELSGVQEETAKQQAALAEQEAARQALIPVVEQALTRARSYVGQALPFKTQARLEELEHLADELHAGRVNAPEALSRLWSVYEDELRLTRENGLYRQQIELGGESQLVDVVKLGMTLLYFRTLDGRCGVAVRGEDGWAYHVVGHEDATRINALFDALQKHVREGFFELPVPPQALPTPEAR